MNTTQTVIRFLDDWEPGTERYGYQICDAVKAIMAGEHKRPLESTILMRLREHAAEYGIRTEGVSIYRKEVR